MARASRVMGLHDQEAKESHGFLNFANVLFSTSTDRTMGELHDDYATRGDGWYTLGATAVCSWTTLVLILA